MAFRARIVGAAGILVASFLGHSSVGADHVPVIAIPGRAGAPVIIDGVDASGAVVYGDWGLHRPGHGSRLIDGGARSAVPYGPGSYFPAVGRPPAYGRREIEPPADRPLPPPAPDYRRSWHVEPDNRPVTEYSPFDPPPVVVTPRFRR